MGDSVVRVIDPVDPSSGLFVDFNHGLLATETTKITKTLVISVFSVADLSGDGVRRTQAMGQQLTVHDPRGYPPKVVGKRLAPRLSTLDGKTIYLVDCLFDNSAVFMDQLQQWFGQHLPAVDARIIRPKETWTDDPEMRAAIAADGDAAILGIGL